jgi:hypothetical protein
VKPKEEAATEGSDQGGEGGTAVASRRDCSAAGATRAALVERPDGGVFAVVVLVVLPLGSAFVVARGQGAERERLREALRRFGIDGLPSRSGRAAAEHGRGAVRPAGAAAGRNFLETLAEAAVDGDPRSQGLLPPRSRTGSSSRSARIARAGGGSGCWPGGSSIGVDFAQSGHPSPSPSFELRKRGPDRLRRDHGW